MDTPVLSRAQSRDAHVFRYRMIMAIIHWGVVVIIILAVLVLRLGGNLDNASVTALYGIVLGHAGTVIGQRASSRATDSAQVRQDVSETQA